MFLALVLQKEADKTVRWGEFDEQSKLNDFVDYLAKCNKPENFIIVHSNGDTIKETNMMSYKNNNYSFDDISKIVKYIM